MRELLLITLFGRDKPAVTSKISALLAEAEANILDLGQAVIHENLNLGMLVELADAEHSGNVVKKILFAAHELDMQVRFQPIDEAEYEDWVALQGKPRHIVTLLARQISAEQISKLTRIMAEHSLNIDNISRLSGRVPLEGNGASACVEFSARGHVDDTTELRARFAELASELDVDIAFQEDNMFRRTRRLVCFDMDSTLIETEVIDELAKAAGVGEKVIAITEAAMRGELDFQQSFRERVALLKGLDESVLQGIAEKLPVTEGAERLISTLRKLGYKTAILSGGFNYFGNYLQQKLGIDYVYANDLDIVDGKVSGEVHTQIVDGQRKADLLRELAAKEQISLKQVVAVGDGANDLPMLSIAGLGIAFRAKPLVRAEAKNAISNLGLDAILYLMGFRDREIS
ncbi:phosphoserine phosphatase SerB [Agaribacterium haliotis]|uniref:phosphoserine phosphatase SerB n=1 Tax=Agaribacterium haliotis TaxID=2013869 RepID=UPI000BB549A7|nr:phosphoserine phosphatase SerB [Agaribacterium haliotis]